MTVLSLSPNNQHRIRSGEMSRAAYPPLPASSVLAGPSSPRRSRTEHIPMRREVRSRRRAVLLGVHLVRNGQTKIVVRQRIVEGVSMQRPHTKRLTRRKYLGYLQAAAIVCSGSRGLVAEEITEDQRGDPDLPSETLRINKAVLDDVLSKHTKAAFEPYRREFPKALVSAAKTFIGATRQGTPDRITEILSLYRLPLKDDHGFVPFCAAGIGFSAALAYRDLLGRKDESERVQSLQPLLPDIEHWYYYPTVSCNDMRLVEMGKRRWVSPGERIKTVPRSGWIVLYAWNRPQQADHCGIIVDANSHAVHTLEFNTSGRVNGSQVNGGAVVLRDRQYDEKIMGFIATDRSPQF
jgi:hypothetical protein